MLHMGPKDIFCSTKISKKKYYLFYVELAPLLGILGPLKSDLGVFWPKIPLYPYNVKTQKTHFLKTLSWADFDLLESNCRHIFLHKNQKIYHR